MARLSTEAPSWLSGQSGQKEEHFWRRIDVVNGLELAHEAYVGCELAHLEPALDCSLVSGPPICRPELSGAKQFRRLKQARQFRTLQRANSWSKRATFYLLRRKKLITLQATYSSDDSRSALVDVDVAAAVVAIAVAVAVAVKMATAVYVTVVIACVVH